MNIGQVRRVVAVLTDEYVIRKNTNEHGDRFTLSEVVKSWILLKKIKKYLKTSDQKATDTVLTALSDIDKRVNCLLKQQK